MQSQTNMMWYYIRRAALGEVAPQWRKREFKLSQVGRQAHLAILTQP